MPDLTYLDIARNSLNGSIPLSIGNLKSMTNLAIFHNRLFGEIPDFWKNTSDLYFLDMSNNSLSGTIPSSIGSLNILKFLMLSKNNLSGEVPSTLQHQSKVEEGRSSIEKAKTLLLRSMFNDIDKYIFVQFEINRFNCGDFTLVQFLGELCPIVFKNLKYFSLNLKFACLDIFHKNRAAWYKM